MQNSYITLFLTFKNEQDILFDERLGLKVYQLLENTRTWEAVTLPLNQSLTTIKSLSISNASEDIVCTGCNFFDGLVDDYYSPPALPQIMEVNGNQYLVFQISVDAADLDPTTEYLRFLVKAGE